MTFTESDIPNGEDDLPKPASRQFSTFYVGDQLYGIDVLQVQEVAKSLPITPIRLAPPHILGLINLRGQIATAVGLCELFGLDSGNKNDRMSMVCKADGSLFSLMVDKIGDVVEVSESSFEPPPETLNESVRRFMKGIYKTPDSILSVLEINKLTTFLAK